MIPCAGGGERECISINVPSITQTGADIRATGSRVLGPNLFETHTQQQQPVLTPHAHRGLTRGVCSLYAASAEFGAELLPNRYRIVCSQGMHGTGITGRRSGQSTSSESLITSLPLTPNLGSGVAPSSETTDTLRTRGSQNMASHVAVRKFRP